MQYLRNHADKRLRHRHSEREVRKSGIRSPRNTYRCIRTGNYELRVLCNSITNMNVMIYQYDILYIITIV